MVEASHANLLGGREVCEGFLTCLKGGLASLNSILLSEEGQQWLMMKMKSALKTLAHLYMIITRQNWLSVCVSIFRLFWAWRVWQQEKLGLVEVGQIRSGIAERLNCPSEDRSEKSLTLVECKSYAHCILLLTRSNYL